MKYFLENIANNIEQQIDESLGLKVLVKVDNFETPAFYYELWKKIKKLTDSKNIELIFKLSDEKKSYFEQTGKFTEVLCKMEENGLVADGVKLTSFRNQIPKKKTLIMLLGTEVSEESGSLQDFYTISVQTIENELKENYSLLFKKFSCMSDDGQKMLDKFYKELFRYVPKNLFKLSKLIDELDEIYDDVEEIIEDICLSLSDDWGFANIQKNRPTKRELLGKSQITIFKKADKFLKRKGFDKLSELKKNEEKIDKYIEEQKKQGVAWPSNYTINTYEEFKNTMLNYIQGVETDLNRKLLCEIDFSYICDALQIKINRRITDSKETTPKLSDEPAVTLAKAIIHFLDYLNQNDLHHNGEFIFRIQSIGISQAINEEEMYATWKNICYVTGGIFEWINNADICFDDEFELRIDSDREYFNFDLASELYDEGTLKRLSAAQILSKINFTISTFDGTAEKAYQWEFDPKEDWVLLFQEVKDLSDIADFEGSFIPFGMNEKLSTIFDVRNRTEFYENYNNLDIDYRTINVVDVFKKSYKEKYPEYFAKFYNLGKYFTEWIKDMHYGIFSTIARSAFSLFEAYNNYAQYLLSEEQTEELVESYKLFVNAFLISNSYDPILNDIDVQLAVIAPYHPAVIEKIVYRYDYIRYGLNNIIKDFSDYYESGNVKETFVKIDRLLELSVIDSAVDILLSGSKKITKSNMYGYYTTYCNHDFMHGEDKVLVDMMQRDGIFSEDFSASEYKTLTPLAKVIRNNIQNYLSVFTIAYHALEIVAVNFTDFQDVVSAMHNILDKDMKKRIGEVKLSILMPVEQQGGQNYLAYWVNSFFDEDSDVNIKIYLNYYKDIKEINKLIPETTDIVFYNDILKEVEVNFSRNEVEDRGISETRFPMVYRTLPISTTSKKRQIEVTQSQFQAATNHAQVVFKYKNMAAYNQSKHLVVREMELDKESFDILESLHECCNWVVCIGIGLDKKLLFNDQKKDYKIIGFTTGEGIYGEYNVTTSACTSMINDLKNRLHMKFKRIFWNSPQNVIDSAVDNCIKNVKYLDGVNVLKALNPHDYDINNFIAYYLTNKYFIESQQEESGINILISLDSYRHWFNQNSNYAKEESKSRPDFLQLKIEKFSDNQDITIQANIIECKFAKENSSHVDKALEQVKHGYEILSKLFSPDSQSIERRYWFAQLYRVLTFSEINMMDSDTKFSIISNKLMAILEGEYKIVWSGSVMTYWIDSKNDGIDQEMLDDSEFAIKQYIFGQSEILKNLSGNESFESDFCDCIKIDESEFYEEEQIEDIYPDSEYVEPSDMVRAAEEKNPYNSESDQIASTQSDEKEIAENEVEFTNQGQVNEEKVEEKVQDIPHNQVSVQLGKSFAQGEKISWNFKDPLMSNRHVLITGKSGQGKTYAIQGMLMEVVKQGVPVVIFDYTGGFVPSKIEEEVKQQLDGKIHQHFVRKDKLQINPFKIQMMDMDGFSIPEDAVDVSERIKDILVHVYNFGEQQGAAIYQACKNGLKKYGKKMNFDYFRKELEELGTKEAKSVYNKIISFLDYDIFDTEHEADWGDILYKDGQVTVFQLSFVQSKDMQIAITEMILWDMWYYSVKNGSEDKPFAVILDEAQNLSFGDKAPTTKILTEGRKFGWSGWFATQFLKGQLKPEEINRLQQAALRIYFKPADDEIQSMANSIDPGKKDINRWIKQLQNSQKGECVVIGDGVYGESQRKSVPIPVKVSSIGERI